ncbi:precorrin-3B synthase [Brucella sp. BE17]|uniref:precorrin-3B synthase n=1 Tax=Brucella sp. BE17 TaxID=3142977 RepID=UPI0031BAD30B
MLNRQPVRTSAENINDRRNACPGLSRMVMARDGAIARIKLPLGRLTADQALRLADIAADFAGGAVELSIRSNLQLRGIAPEHWDQAVGALHEAGLGANVPSADDIRNVMVSPTAGIDAGQLLDVSPLARSLLAMLEDEVSFHSLSPKFSFQIDGGENCAMISHPGDIWFSAMKDGKHFVFGLASAPDEATLGKIEAQTLLPFVKTLLQLSIAQGSPARMKYLFQTMPVAKFMRELAARFAIEPLEDWKRSTPDAFAHLGKHRQVDGKYYVGATPLLGRLNATQLKSIATIARDANGGEIRLTPWQSLLLPHIGGDQCDALIQQLHDMGLATAVNSPQARLRACTGTSGCASARADTRSDAQHMAAQLYDDTGAVHLTGCAKSCAALAPLPYTLLATAPGRYDVFFADKAGPSRFGQLLASDMAIDKAVRLLNSHERKP